MYILPFSLSHDWPMNNDDDYFTSCAVGFIMLILHSVFWTLLQHRSMYADLPHHGITTSFISSFVLNSSPYYPYSRAARNQGRLALAMLFSPQHMGRAILRGLFMTSRSQGHSHVLTSRFQEHAIPTRIGDEHR
jgi:hypothetical protein